IDTYLSKLESSLIGARGAPPPRAATPRVIDSVVRGPTPAPAAGADARGSAAAGAVSSRLSIMQSNGGTISSAAARAQAVRTVLSGPAGGVVGGPGVAAAAGISRLISFDMGGTSTDVSLIDGGVQTTRESRV